MKNAVIAWFFIWLFGVIGYGKNIYNLTQCDFNAPYKAEVLRIIGIPVAPVGAILGYIKIND